ncbi:MAG: hypothetical protein Q7S22_06910 [Candidatus Micrarchaeota archaeon]|nr:hypothetical protein [Candidatus Micrarchaeota archaeon]
MGRKIRLKEERRNVRNSTDQPRPKLRVNRFLLPSSVVIAAAVVVSVLSRPCSNHSRPIVANTVVASPVQTKISPHKPKVSEIKLTASFLTEDGFIDFQEATIPRVLNFYFGRSYTFTSNDFSHIFKVPAGMAIVFSKNSGFFKFLRDSGNGELEGYTFGIVNTDSGSKFVITALAYPFSRPPNFLTSACSDFTEESMAMLRQLANPQEKTSAITLVRILDTSQLWRPGTISALIQAQLDRVSSSLRSSVHNPATMFRDIAEIRCMLADALSKKSLADLASSEFLNTLIHESMHGVYTVHGNESTLAAGPFRKSIEETMGGLIQLGYGPEYRLSLFDLFTLSNSILRASYRNGNFESMTEGNPFENAYLNITGRIDMDGIGLVMLPSRDEAKIRAAARDALDWHSTNHYGKPFSSFFPETDITSLLEQGRAYLDTLRE